MNDTPKNDTTILNLANTLLNRYGPLALARAAGAIATATRQGDTESQTLWRQVLDHLRRSLPSFQMA